MAALPRCAHCGTSIFADGVDERTANLNHLMDFHREAWIAGTITVKTMAAA